MRRHTAGVLKVLGEVAGQARAVYTGPVVSTVLTALLASSAFVLGVAQALGSEFLNLFSKQDVIAAALFLMLPLAVIMGIVRNYVLFALDVTFGASKDDWYNRVLFVGGLIIVGLFLLLIFAIALPPELIFAASGAVFMLLVLGGLFAAWWRFRQPGLVFAMLLVTIFLCVQLGITWASLLRNSQPNLTLDLKDGPAANVAVALAGSHGMLVFVDRGLDPQFFPWEAIRGVRASESAKAARSERLRYEREKSDSWSRYICEWQNTLRHYLYNPPRDCRST
jgi:hypothetical protein